MDYSKLFTGSPAEKLLQAIFFVEVVDDMTEAMSELLLGEKLPFAVVSTENGEILHPAYKKTTKTVLRRLATAYRDHAYANQDLWVIYCQNPENHLSPWRFKKTKRSQLNDEPINNKILGLLKDVISGNNPYKKKGGE